MLDLESRLDVFVLTREDIQRIPCRVLKINGEKYILIATQDTINLAAWASNSKFLLFLDDDHCAIGYIREWLQHDPCWPKRNP